LAGHLLLKGLQGVLKVRITADLEQRVVNEMQREGISEQEARTLILKDDQQRRGWTKSLHGVDPWDSNLYDLVICINTLSVEDAVNIICQVAGSDGFRTTKNHMQQIKDFALACRIKAELVEDFPSVGVVCQYGNVIVYSKDKPPAGSHLQKRLDGIQKDNKEIYNLEIHSSEAVPPEAI
jgi:hypothetical protein